MALPTFGVTYSEVGDHLARQDLADYSTQIDRWVQEHSGILSGHLGNDIDGNFGDDLTMSGNRHRNLGHVGLDDFHERPELRALYARRRLA